MLQRRRRSVAAGSVAPVSGTARCKPIRDVAAGFGNTAWRPDLALGRIVPGDVRIRIIRGRYGISGCGVSRNAVCLPGV